jgi:hypothetical protein
MGLQHIGRGQAFGITGSDDFYATKILQQGATVTDNFDKKEFKNGTGDVVGMTAYNGKQQMVIEMIASADTIANAELAIKFPTKLQKVILTAFKEVSAGKINGNWIYEGGGQITFANEDVVKIRLPLFRMDTDISAPVNA